MTWGSNWGITSLRGQRDDSSSPWNVYIRVSPRVGLDNWQQNDLTRCWQLPSLHQCVLKSKKSPLENRIPTGKLAILLMARESRERLRKGGRVKVCVCVYACTHACAHTCSVLSNSCATPWTVAHEAPLSMEFSRQEYWSGLQFPPSGGLPNPRIEPALAGGFFPTEPPGKPKGFNTEICMNIYACTPIPVMISQAGNLIIYN